MIAGLLARGFSAHEAAWRAASLHGAAARAFGPGLIAEDIADAIPQVLRAAGGPA
jgi:NAD(P)H-hydrate repair Nnr-like enzyme with NAD(P)H-hydrate dehydratase domain